MNRIFALLAIALAAVAMPSPALAASTHYDDVDYWTIYQDAGSSHCYMIGRFDNDVTVTVFIDTDANATFWLQNEAWRSLTEDRTYYLDVQFDRMGEWSVTAKAKHDHDGPGVIWNTKIMVPDGQSSFLSEFAVAKQMRMMRNGKFVTSIDLTSSYAASLKTIECSGELRVNDPFSGGVAEDPFTT